MYKTRDIRLVELRYYEDGKVVDLSRTLSFGIFVKIGGNYFNFLNMLDEYPILEDMSCVDFIENCGNKIMTDSINISEYTGYCWLAKDENFEEIFQKEEIDKDTLIDYIVWSKQFFKDRKDVVIERLEMSVNPMAMYRILKNDLKKTEEMDKLIEDKINKKQKVKRNW